MTPAALRACFICGLLLAPAAVLAQQPAGDGDHRDEKSEILVTGRQQTLDPVTVAHEARSVSRETDLRHEPLARFEGYACPGVIGLKREYAEQVVGRIRMVADDLGIPLAKNGDCHPNIIIAFTEDGRADLAALQRKNKILSEVLAPDERRELLEEPGPARVLSIVETRMQNGSIVPRSHDLVNPPVGRMEGGQSLIKTGTHKEIVNVVLLFDRDKIRGKTLNQIADYAVMRVFTRTRDATGAKAPDSILTLFDAGNTPPAGLTEFDRAYLAALYEGSAHVTGLSKLLRVSHHLKKIEAGKE